MYFSILICKYNNVVCVGCWSKEGLDQLLLRLECEYTAPILGAPHLQKFVIARTEKILFICNKKVIRRLWLKEETKSIQWITVIVVFNLREQYQRTRSEIGSWQCDSSPCPSTLPPFSPSSSQHRRLVLVLPVMCGVWRGPKSGATTITDNWHSTHPIIRRLAVSLPLASPVK